VKPSKDTARELKLLPGVVAGGSARRGWRWNGTEYERLMVGMMCRRVDGRWGRWTGEGWAEVPLREESLVWVTAARGWTVLRHELCLVEDVVARPSGKELLCTPWPEMDRKRSVVVPALIVEPFAHPDELRFGPTIHDESWLRALPDEPPDLEYYATEW
jgi:hypothetical protein